MTQTTSRQINITASPELVAKLEKTCPAGMPLSTFAREVLERLLKPEQLPLLQPEGGRRGPQMASIDWRPFEAQMEKLRERLDNADELQWETLRAVRAADDWTRRRLMPQNAAEVTDIKKDLRSEMDRKAANAGEQAVREWERSVGR